ncbi:hypothetical protein IQ250_19150 [Pseudanabaenaceae cyanobacterium LEGE 13415]|nr:hypothetical protein [Pseudanabaenaceae cyanobacterium LEGE 13415]
MFSPEESLAPYSQGHSLFAQLRSRFPQGALVSELVQVHDGQFVVRAIVQVGTTTMATGMAAADKIEVAEDRARVRAMEVLGISPTGGATTFDVAARTEPEPRKQVEPSVATAIPEIPEIPEISEISLPAVEALVPELPKKVTRKKKEEPIEAAPVPDLLSFPGLDMPEIKSAPVEFTREPVEFTPDFEEDEVEPPAPEPIDLSDAIAQIGTEIERIGWTKKQGSTYLQDTYGKKTRAELDEDELIEFLHYLKALPSKGQGIPF